MPCGRSVGAVARCGRGRELAVAAWLAVVATTDAAVTNTTQPHIILIIADDMGWNDVSFHGSNQILTPNLDALAYNGLILNHHYTQPSCSPSRGSLLSGKYPAHTGLQQPIVAGNTGALSLDHKLLPQYLAGLGYQTHLVGKWHLGYHQRALLPCHRGFQSHFGFWNGFLGFYGGLHNNDHNMTGIDARRNEIEAFEEFQGVYITDLLTQEAVSVIDKHSLGPLFLEVALSAPHTGNKGERLEVPDLVENEREFANITDFNRRLYAGMVRGVDDAVGTILEALQARGMLQNSIVMFTSDNGAPTQDPINDYGNSGSNYPLRGMKFSSHEGGVRTAAALWSPLVTGGRVFDHLIHISDWLPTLYSAAGGDVSNLGPLDGVDQWAALTDSKNSVVARSEMLIELSPITGSEAIIRWPWKLVKSKVIPLWNSYGGESGRQSEYDVARVLTSPAATVLNFNTPAKEILALRDRANIENKCLQVTRNNTSSMPLCDQQFCLFSLQADPCETKDLAAEYPSVVKELRAALNAYRITLVPSTQGDSDPRANPYFYRNYWSIWADHDNPEAYPWTSHGITVLSHTNIIFTLLLVYIIVVFNVKFCQFN